MMPKKVRRALSADESLDRYHQRFMADYEKEQEKRWNTVRVFRACDGYDEVLTVLNVSYDYRGVRVVVR